MSDLASAFNELRKSDISLGKLIALQLKVEDDIRKAYEDGYGAGYDEGFEAGKQSLTETL